jgi:hypothetical protein
VEASQDIAVSADGGHGPSSSWPGRELGGCLLAVVGGTLVLVSIGLPWRETPYPASLGGWFMYVQSGWQVGDALLVAVAGGLVLLAGLIMSAWPAAQRMRGPWMAAVGAMAFGAVLLGGWWLREPPGEAGVGNVVGALGLAVCLVAVSTGSPGSRRQRAALAAGTVAASLVGVLVFVAVSPGLAPPLG